MQQQTKVNIISTNGHFCTAVALYAKQTIHSSTETSDIRTRAKQDIDNNKN